MAITPSLNIAVESSGNKMRLTYGVNIECVFPSVQGTFGLELDGDIRVDRDRKYQDIRVNKIGVAYVCEIGEKINPQTLETTIPNHFLLTSSTIIPTRELTNPTKIKVS